MKAEDRFDLVIRDQVEQHFPDLLRDFGSYAHLWIKAQIWQESRMDPDAVSPAGAQGLMQLMPATDLEIDGKLDGSDVVGNIDNGVRYLAEQYHYFPEIPAPRERLRFSLASYNGGRGYVNRALSLARINAGHPGNYSDWQAAGSLPGDWQRWEVAKMQLMDPNCVVHGLRPDARQMIEYVHYIESRYSQYLAAAHVPRTNPAWRA
jgi:membrane-bound lytic murein transglycosylase MltF